MKILLSPAKSLDYKSDLPEDFGSCIEKWKKYSTNY